MKFNILISSLLWLLILLLWALSWSAYGYYSMIHSDDPIEPSLRIVHGWAKIIRGDSAIILSADEEYTLKVNDVIETEKDSIATVVWPDHSITRLWALTRIVIHMIVAQMWYEDIRISFSLKKGKIWSTVVRALIGDSYFETRLPKNNIVVWVRGTIFEVNLDHQYIRAIEHGITLRDDSGKSLFVVPGKLVDSENIWIQRGMEFLDSAWSDFNTISDTDFLVSRAKAVNLALDKNTNFLIRKYDACIRWILSHFDAFEMLTIGNLIDRGDMKSIILYSSGSLWSYYQRIISLGEPDTLDTLRSSLLEKSIQNGSGMGDLLDTLRIWALWDTLDTGKILPWAEKLLGMPTLGLSKWIDTLEGIATQNTLIQELQKSFLRGLETVK